MILYSKVWGVKRGRSPSILHFRRGKKAQFVGFSNKKKNMRKNFFLAVQLALKLQHTKKKRNATLHHHRQETLTDQRTDMDTNITKQSV